MHPCRHARFFRIERLGSTDCLPTLPACLPCRRTAFAAVLFQEIPEGDCFVARKPSTHSYLRGAIRHGRDLETHQSMLRDFTRMWTSVTGQSEAEFLVSLTEVDPANVMEMGSILPEPGHEQGWFDENRARLAELGVLAELGTTA